ncbi:hypothetical protein [Pseudolysinimonas sp.]
MVAVLTGCSVSAPTTPPSTPIEDPNSAACENFLRVFNEIADANEERNADEITVDEWYAIVDDAATDYAAVALEAGGDVKSRIEDLVDLIDRQEYGVRSLNGLSDDFDLYLSYLQRIGQACTTAGVNMSFSTS